MHLAHAFHQDDQTAVFQRAPFSEPAAKRQRFGSLWLAPENVDAIVDWMRDLEHARAMWKHIIQAPSSVTAHGERNIAESWYLALNCAERKMLLLKAIESPGWDL